MKYKYYLTNSIFGKGFITHKESTEIKMVGFPCNIWAIPTDIVNNVDISWINKVSGVLKTKDEAQALLDAEIIKAQAAWNILPKEIKANRQKPVNIVLE